MTEEEYSKLFQFLADKYDLIVEQVRWMKRVYHAGFSTQKKMLAYAHDKLRMPKFKKDKHTARGNNLVFYAIMVGLLASMGRKTFKGIVKTEWGIISP